MNLFGTNTGKNVDEKLKIRMYYNYYYYLYKLLSIGVSFLSRCNELKTSEIKHHETPYILREMVEWKMRGADRS